MTEKKVATMRLVDVDKIEPHEQLESLGNGQYEYVRVAYMDDIDVLPTVDAVPVVHGRWIRVYSRPGVFKYLGWTCDQCDQRTGNEYAPQWYKFCPNCGAKMDGKGNGNEAD